MPGRIVIHAGFHKTGTTTVQRFLKENSETLWPLTAIGLRHRFPDLLHSARAYSVWRDPITLAQFAHRFDTFIRALDLGPHRRLVISSEELAGHLPGREDVADYGAVPALMGEMVDVLEDIHGEVDLRFHFSTRATAPWLKSAYSEHVKSSRMVLDFEEFREKNQDTGNLHQAFQAIARTVGADRCSALPLEATRALPLGPADPIIDLLGLGPKKRALLRPVASANEAPSDETLQAFLAFNRSDMTGPEVGQAKRDYLAKFSGTPS